MMTQTATSSEDEALAFIRSGVWVIDGVSRSKTRTACLEVLRRLPRDVFEFVTKSRRLLLIAPPIGSPGTVSPFVTVATPGEEFLRFQVVTLPAIAEQASHAQLVLIIVKCIAACLRESGEKRFCSPEERALEWGFSRELALAGVSARAGSRSRFQVHRRQTVQ